jgi:outer membrane receptor protein involved in Fe transport
MRVDTFSYNVLNSCAAQGDFDDPSRTRPPTNESCHDQTQFGAHREPVQRSSTAAVKMLPRATVVLGPFADMSLTASYGQGVRSIDPVYISQDLGIPFASIRAYEAGADYARDLGWARVSARTVFFVTKVDRDLIFSQTVGRNVLANGTTRRGWLGALRLNARHFDSSTNLTFVRPKFDDTDLDIPYVPTWVMREDAALFGDLPWKLWSQPVTATSALGFSYIGRRALPYGEQSNVISVLDGSASLEWMGWNLSFSATNLLDRRYHLGEYNYASDFHSQPKPTLVPSRQFTAGAPRGFFLTVAKTWGAAS